MSTKYRCGHCGNSLTEAELDSGVCPHCGAQISPFGDVVQPPPKSAVAADWPQTFLEPPIEAPPVTTKVPTHRLEDPEERLNVIRTSRTTGRLAPLTPEAPPPRPPTAALMLGIGIAVALVLACTIAATGTLLNGLATAQGVHATPTVHHPPTLAPTATYGGLGFPTEAPDPTPLPFTGQIPTAEPTSTPYGGIPTPTPRPTSEDGGQPFMNVSPTLWSDRCDKNVPTFAVVNQGGGQFSWSATSPNGVNFNPNTGTQVAGGPPTMVTVTLKSPTDQGQITFTDTTDAGTQPITVAFVCH